MERARRRATYDDIINDGMAAGLAANHSASPWGRAMKRHEKASEPGRVLAMHQESGCLVGNKSGKAAERPGRRRQLPFRPPVEPDERPRMGAAPGVAEVAGPAGGLLSTSIMTDPTTMGAVSDLTSTLERLDPTGARALRHALHGAGGIHRLRVAHLIVGLLVLDGGFVLRKLRGIPINRADLVRQIYSATGAPNGGDPAGTVRILLLAGALASPGARINTQHLLAAILLADGNPMAAYLTSAGIDRQLFVRQRFAHLFAAGNALRDVAPEAAAAVAGNTLGPDGAVLQAWAAPPPPPVPPAPRGARADDDSRLPERAARQWLRKLIPSQAERYAERGFVEIDSTLCPGRRYRIHHRRLTEIYERGAPSGRSCLQLSDTALPPTDRVIAEYFLIQGDERSYLKTANIVRG
jgi:hypothetical protein